MVLWTQLKKIQNETAVLFFFSVICFILLLVAVNNSSFKSVLLSYYFVRDKNWLCGRFSAAASINYELKVLNICNSFFIYL